MLLLIDSVDIVELPERPYAMENQNGVKFITNQHVLATVGKAEREWPMLFCSMGKITEASYIDPINFSLTYLKYSVSLLDTREW